MNYVLFLLGVNTCNKGHKTTIPVKAIPRSHWSWEIKNSICSSIRYLFVDLTNFTPVAIICIVFVKVSDRVKLIPNEELY